MRSFNQNFNNQPLDIVGSTKFGFYPKISVEQTYNMFISDNWLVPYAGYAQVNLSQIDINGVAGRGIYSSNINNLLFFVIGDSAYSGIVSANNILSVEFLFQLNTQKGPVYIAEGLNTTTGNQVVFADGNSLYVYKPETGVLITLVGGSAQLPFLPGYITFQDTRFIAAALDTPNWWLSNSNDATDWLWGPGTPKTAVTGTLQTKPDNVVAVQRFPGRGNLLLVFGTIVTEFWQDVGAALFPYQRLTSQNLDYGCLNPQTIAYNNSKVVWLGGNEKSGPVIMYTTGGDLQTISTDGINFKLAQLTNPSNSYGFLFRQAGHEFYQITFPDDNLSYAYDFNTNQFFTVSDEFLGFHIAKQVAFYNDNYYFVSISDPNVYQFSNNYTNYFYINFDEDGSPTSHYAEIPRVRITKNLRLPDNNRFAVNSLAFTIEQGVNFTQNFPTKPYYNTEQAIILNVSKDGGETFSSGFKKILNDQGKFMNRNIFWNIGSANDFVFKFQFVGFDRFTATSGIASIFQ